jgi:hypothetical protein
MTGRHLIRDGLQTLVIMLAASRRTSVPCLQALMPPISLLALPKDNLLRPTARIYI